MGKRLLCILLSIVLIASNLETTVFAMQSEETAWVEVAETEVEAEETTETGTAAEETTETEVAVVETTETESAAVEQTAETEAVSEEAATEKIFLEEVPLEKTAVAETLTTHTVEEVKDTILERMKMGIETYQKEISLGDLGIPESEENNLQKLYQAYIGDKRLQYFWLAESCNISTDYESGTIEYLSFYSADDKWLMPFDYTGVKTNEFDIARIKKARVKFAHLMESIVAPMDPDMSDLEKAYFLYLYILHNVEYDFDFEYSKEYGYAYDALVNGKARDEGFYEAYAVLCLYVGVPVLNIYSPGIGHGWNMILIDGKWCYVDCNTDDWKMFLVGESYLRSRQKLHPGVGRTCYDWMLYGGLDSSNVLGISELPEGATTEAYSDYLLHSNAIYRNGYWYYYEKYDGLYRATLDRTTNEKLADAKDVCDSPFMDRVYYADCNEDATIVYCYDTENGNISVVATYPPSEVCLSYESGNLVVNMGSTVDILNIDNPPAAIRVIPPVKQSYEVGDEFDPTGMSVMLYLSDGTAQWQEDYTISGFSSDTAGKKEVHVSCQGLSTSFAVEVTEESKEQGIHLKRQSYQFDEIGATATIQAVLRGADENSEFTYTSSDESVASVDGNGRIVAKKLGTAEITVSSGSYHQMVYVTVDTTKYTGGGEAQELVPVYEYNDADHTAKLIGCTGSGTVLDIPQTVTLAGTFYTVTELGARMSGVSQLETVSIPDSVTKIGSFAFGGSKDSRAKLRNVRLPKNCELAVNAFSYTELEQVTISSGIILGDQAFMGCTSLKSVTIDTEIVSTSCFADCSSLTAINWGTNVREIKYRAFEGCNLTSVAIPEGVTTVGSYAFYMNASLSEVTIPSTVIRLDFCIFDKVSSELTIHLYCTEIQQVGSGGITDNKSAKYIFHGQYTREKIELFGQGIDYEVVDGEDPYPDGPPEDASIFEEDRVLIRVGEKYRIRTNYYDLRELTFVNDSPHIVSVDEQGMASMLRTGECTVTAYNADGEKLDSLVFTVYDMYFNNEEIFIPLGETADLVLNQSPDLISNFDCADYQLDGGKVVDILSKETKTMSSTMEVESGYYGWITVKAVNTGDSALTVRDPKSGASASCHIIVGERSNSLQDDTFTYVELSEGELAVTGPVIHKYDPFGAAIWLDRETTYYKNIDGVRTMTIPSEVTINDKQYRVTQIMENAFNPYYHGKMWTYQQTGIDELIIEEGIETIRNDAFNNFISEKIKLPNSLKYIGDRAFAQSPIKEIELPAHLETMGEGCFYQSAIRKVVFWGGPSKIPAYTFSGCGYLRTVILSESITSIEKNAFFGCLELQSITLPKNITYLDPSAFDNTYGAKTIVLFCTKIEKLPDKGYLSGVSEYFVSKANDNEQMLQNMDLSEEDEIVYYLEDVVCEEMYIQGQSSMRIGESQQLAVPKMYYFTPEPVINWTSSSPEVAAVSNGYVKALSVGSSQISATLANGEVLTFSIKVLPKPDDSMPLVEQFFGEGICVLANPQKTLADISLPQGWAFENPEEKLVTSDEVQYFAGTYTQNGETKTYKIPVLIVEVSGVRIAGASSMMVGELMVYQAVLEGSKGVESLPCDIEWSYTGTSNVDFTTTSDQVQAVAKKAGSATLNVTLKLEDGSSFQSSFSLSILEEDTSERKDFGYYENADFSEYYHADGSVGTQNDNSYLLSYGIISETDRTVAVTHLSDGVGKIIIPETVEYNSKTYQVVELSEIFGKWHLKQMSELILPATLTSIHPKALASYDLLNKITVEEGNPALTVGEDGALYNKDKTYLYFIPVKSTGKFEVPASVTDFNPTEAEKIGSFASGSLLKGNLSDGMYTPDGKKLIYAPIDENGVFEIPYGVEEIGSLCMYNNAPCTKIVIPRTVYKLDEYAFAVKNAADPAKEIVFEEGNAITQIPRFAFYGMYISNIKLPKTIQKIGTKAFSSYYVQGFSMEGLDHLTYIGECAFNGDENQEAFWGYEFILPASVEYVGAEAFGFSYWENRPYILYYEGVNPPKFGTSKNDSIYYIEHRVPEAAVAAYEAALAASGRDTSTEVVKGYSADTKLKQCPLTTQNEIKYALDTQEHTAKVVEVMDFEDGVLTIPESIEYEGNIYTVTEIGAYLSDISSFLFVRMLKVVELPASIEIIGDYAFDQCERLFKVSFKGNKLKSIGASAFSNCFNLEILALPGSLTSIDPTAFEDITPNESLKDHLVILAEPGSLAAEIKTVVGILLVGRDVFVSDQVYWTKNGTNACILYADKADEIPATVSDGTQTYIVNEIHGGAYKGSTAQSLTVPKSVETIGQHAFALSYVKELKFEEGSRLKTLKKGVFYNSRFERIEIPETVTSLGSRLFYYATALKQVVFKGALAEIEEGIPSEGTMFGGCSSLKSIIVPREELTAYQEAFEGQYPENEDFEVELVGYSATNSKPVTAITVSEEELTLDIGESRTVSVLVQPEDTTGSTLAIWKSSDQAVVRVCDGKITALSEGTAVVTATVGGFSKEIPITVNPVQKGQVSFEAPVLSWALTEDKKVHLTWQAIEGADGYALYRSQSKDSGFVRQKAAISGNRTGYLDLSVKNGYTYYYKLAAYKKYSDGTYEIGELSDALEVKVINSRYEKIEAVAAAGYMSHFKVGDSLEKLREYLTVTLYAKDGTSKVIEDYIICLGYFTLGSNTVDILWQDPEDEYASLLTSVPVFISSSSVEGDSFTAEWKVQGIPEGKIGQPYESIRNKIKVSYYGHETDDFTIWEGTFTEGTNEIVIKYNQAFIGCRLAAVGVEELSEPEGGDPEGGDPEGGDPDAGETDDPKEEYITVHYYSELGGFCGEYEGELCVDAQVKKGEKIGSFPAMALEGFDFNGWYNSLIDQMATADTIVNEEIWLYASWNCRITFEPRGGTMEEDRVRTYPIWSSYGELPTPVREGYRFRGWFTTASYCPDEQQITSESVVNPYGEHTLYARWFKNVSAVEAPVASIPSGSEVEPKTRIYLTTETSNAQIYYTLDKTIPSADSFLYDDGIVLTPEMMAEDHTITICAVATRPDKTEVPDSEVVSFVYTMNYDPDIPEGLWVKGISDLSYTGKAVTLPELQVYYGNKLLQAKVDYSVTYKNNINAGTAKVTIKGKGNYKGSRVEYFDILPLDIRDALISKQEIWLTYNKKVQKPTNTILYELNGKMVTLKAKRDFEYIYPNTNSKDKENYDPQAFVAPGTYTVIVRGKGNYAKMSDGSPLETSFTVHISNNKTMAALKYTISNAVYNEGERVAPNKVEVKNGKKLLAGYAVTDETAAQAALQDSQIVDNYDYVYYTANDTAVGKASITFLGTGKSEAGYVGTVTKSYSITGTSIKKIKLKGVASSYEYTGNAIMPAGAEDDAQTPEGFGVYFAATGTTPEITLTKGKDYTVSYAKNVSAGTATLLIKGINGYTGTAKKTFKIINTKTTISKVKLEGVASSYEYTGGAIMPAGAEDDEQTPEGFCVYFAATRTTPEKILKKGEDYTVSYAKNVNAGTATLLISGINGYTGTVKKTFKIKAYEVTGDRIRVESVGGISYEEKGALPAITYEKGGVKPAVVVYDTNKAEPLVLGKDYTVTYSNNTSVNDGSSSKVPTVTISGKGNYAGKDKKAKKVFFQIAKKDISETTITATDIVYQGKIGNCKPTISLVDTNGSKLKSGTDYSKQIIYTYAFDTLVYADGIYEERMAGDLVQSYDIIPSGAEIVATVKALDKNYSGETSVMFRCVTWNISGATVKISDQYYTGNDICPGKDQIKITVKGRKEPLGNDEYEIVSVYNNRSTGTATVVLRGTGSCGGLKKATFAIKQRTIS